MSADDVIARLTEAKGRLATGKEAGLRAANAIAQARTLVGHALGRQAAGAQLLGAIHAKERSLLGRVMAIDTLATRVDAAIEQTRVIGDTGKSGERSA
jgi:hypothetical protein